MTGIFDGRSPSTHYARYSKALVFLCSCTYCYFVLQQQPVLFVKLDISKCAIYDLRSTIYDLRSPGVDRNNGTISRHFCQQSRDLSIISTSLHCLGLAWNQVGVIEDRCRERGMTALLVGSDRCSPSWPPVVLGDEGGVEFFHPN